jgi:hypothetical protein
MDFLRLFPLSGLLVDVNKTVGLLRLRRPISIIRLIRRKHVNQNRHDRMKNVKIKEKEGNEVTNQLFPSLASARLIISIVHYVYLSAQKPFLFIHSPPANMRK